VRTKDEDDPRDRRTAANTTETGSLARISGSTQRDIFAVFVIHSSKPMHCITVIRRMGYNALQS